MQGLPSLWGDIYTVIAAGVIVAPSLSAATGALLNDNGTTVQTINIGAANGWYCIESIDFVRTGGTAATYSITMASNVAYAVTDVTVRYISGIIAVATPTRGRPKQYIQADANGRVYWRSGFNAGADNNANFYFVFSRAKP